MRIARNTAKLSLLVCGVSAFALTAGLTHAQATEGAVRFEISSQPLASALDEFSRQANLDVIMRADTIAGKSASPVEGMMSVEEALERMLQGSGLNYELDARGIIIIRSGSSESSSGIDRGGLNARQFASNSRDFAVSGNSRAVQAGQTQDTSGVAAQAATDTALEVEEIVVTGSRIARAGFDTVQPAYTLSADFMQERGHVDLINAFEESPVFGVSENDAGEAGAELLGVNFVNVFGIGTGRTLTVINGRRAVTSNTPTTSVGSGLGDVDPGLQVDLNTIPTLLIDRIETIFTGGAPVYGTDAIGGTVNIILKDDFEGLTLDAQYGIAEDDGEKEAFTVRGLWGVNTGDGNGNITVSMEWTDQTDGLKPTGSDFVAQAWGFCQNPQSTGPNDGIPDNVLCQDGFSRFENPNTALPLLLRDPVTGQVDQTSLFDSNGNRINTSPAASGGFDSPFLLRDGDGNPLIFDTNGNLITFEEANLGSDVGSAGSTSTIGANGFENPIVSNLGIFNPVLTPKQRWNLFAKGHYEFFEDARWFFEGSFSRVEANNLITRPRNVTDAFGNNQLRPAIVININDNPFVTDQTKQILMANGSYDPNLVDENGDPVEQFFKINRSNVDVNGDIATDFREQDVFRFVTGFEGDIEAFGRDWSWDTAVIYGESNAVGTFLGIDAQRFNFALDAVTDPETGQPACRVQVEGFDPGFNAQPDSARNTAVNECVPFNPLGLNPLTPEQEEFLLQPERRITENRQLLWQGNVGGDLVSLPAGPWAVFAGFEHRRETGIFEGDRTSRNALTESGPINDVRGQFNTTEFYGETLVPIIQGGQGIPGLENVIDRLELEGALRFVDNSRSGNDVTWTAGGRLRPNLPLLGLTLRGNFTRSVRSPAITELFLPRQEIRTLADDPCDRDNIFGGPNPALRQANCQAAGAPADFEALIEDQRQPAISGGNPNLEPEKSDSWTVGGIIAPGFLPGLELTVDWTEINIKDAIEVLDATSILNACFDSANFPNAGACNAFDRGSDFNISRLETGFVNAAEFRFKGLVSNVSWSFEASDLPFAGNVPGSFQIFGNFFHVSKLERQIGAQDLDIMDGEQFNEKLKFQLNLRYRAGRASFLWQTRHLGSFVFDRQESEEVRPADQSKIPSMRIHNLTLTYQLTDYMSLRGVVNNILDERDGPLRFANAFSRDMTFSDPFGRRFLFGVNMAF